VIVVLRVQGPQLDLDQCLKWIPETSIEAQWRVGSKRIGGKVNTTSGFTLLLGEGENHRRALEAAIAAFHRVAARVAELIQSGASAEVDCGLMVTAGGSQSVEFAPEFLRALEQAGVSLVVSAYPCSDSDD
jgi:hypothetical protein